MKRFFKSTLVACLMLCMMLGLVACGNLPLTEENVVGSYKITRVVYTANENNTAGYQSCDYTKEQYDALIARREAGTATAQDDNDYYVIAGLFDGEMEVRADGTIYEIYDGSPDFWAATWKIEDGKFVYKILQGLDYAEYSAEWENNKLVLTRNVTTEHDPDYGVSVYYYEKVKKEEVALTAQNAIGEYRAINAVFTPNANNTQYTTGYAVNRNAYNYYANKVNNGTADQQQREQYEIFTNVYCTNFRLTDDGKVLNDDNNQEGLWAIQNGKFVYTETADTVNGYSAKWDNGRIVITVNLTYAMGPQGTIVFTLEKVTAV